MTLPSSIATIASGNDAQRPPAPRLLSWPFVQILLIQLTFGFSFSAFFLLPKYLQLELAASPAQIGSVIGLGLAVAVLAVPVVGLTIDRWSRCRLLQLGTALGALAALGHIWVSDVGPLLYLLRCAHGLSFVIAFNTAATLAVELAPKERLSQALGLFGIAMLCTNAIAPAIVEPLAARQGWNAGFLLAASFAGMASAIALFVPQPALRARSDEPPSSQNVLNTRLFAVCYASMMIGLGFGSIVTYIQPFALSLGEPEVKDLFIGYTITAIVVRVGLGAVADRYGRRLVAAVSLALYAMVTVCAAQLQPGYLLVVGLGLGVAHGLAYPALNAISIEHVGEQQRGLVMTIFNGCFNLGFAVSVLCFGRLAEVQGFSAVFVVAGLFVLSGVGGLWSPRSPKINPPPA